jgi:tetratricopeptide (TPR) repeat protein
VVLTVAGNPYLQGSAFVKLDGYAAAVPYLSKAIAAKPEYRAYFWRAGAYQDLGRLKLAIADYTQAISRNPASQFLTEPALIAANRLGAPRMDRARTRRRSPCQEVTHQRSFRLWDVLSSCLTRGSTCRKFHLAGG